MWIKCDDRLPENNTRVLTCNKSGDIGIELLAFNGRTKRCEWYDGRRFLDYPPTHWQPLPAPPKTLK